MFPTVANRQSRHQATAFVQPVDPMTHQEHFISTGFLNKRMHRVQATFKKRHLPAASTCPLRRRRFEKGEKHEIRKKKEGTYSRGAKERRTSYCFVPFEHSVLGLFLKRRKRTSNGDVQNNFREIGMEDKLASKTRIEPRSLSIHGLLKNTHQKQSKSRDKLLFFS